MKIPACTNCDSAKCYIKLYASPVWRQKVNKSKTTGHYKKGASVFSEGDPVIGIYFIYRGKVKVFNSGLNNKTHILRLAGSGKILGHRGFGKFITYPIGATAIENATICFVPKATFIEVLKNNQQMALELINFYAQELRRAENKLRSLSQMTVKQKLAETIITLKEIHGSKKNKGADILNVVLTRQEYADIVGASIEEVIRTLSQLNKENLIHLDGKKIGIVNRKKLEEMLIEFGPLRLP